MGICSPGSLPLYTVMFDAMLLSDLANKFSLSLSLSLSLWKYLIANFMLYGHISVYTVARGLSCLFRMLFCCLLNHRDHFYRMYTDIYTISSVVCVCII